MPYTDNYVVRGGGNSEFFSSTPASVKTLAEPFFEGLVVDVILDHREIVKKLTTDEPDNYDIGDIKIRIFGVDEGRSTEQLEWASPMDSTIQEIPLIGEVVTLNRVLNKLFYTKKVRLAHRLQENAMINLEKALDSRHKLSDNAGMPTNGSEISLTKFKFGRYFKPDSRVRQLKHFEGDVIIQGRMGHSIRFGSSQMQPGNVGLAPNIIMRTGQAKDIEKTNCSADSIYGLILEEPDADASSIWMTSDQAIPFSEITMDAGSHYRSIKNPPQKYDGASILINSDRLILGAKKTHILMFANEEIYLNSYKNTSIDTDSSIILSANIDIDLQSGRSIEGVADVDFKVSTGKDILLLSMEKTSLLSGKIFIGSVSNDEEPMVGGASLSKWLARLILVLMGEPSAILPWTTQKTTVVPPVPIPGTATLQHTIPMIGTLNPMIVKGLVQLYAELVKPNMGQTIPSLFAGAPFNSGDNFVRLGNDLVTMQKNNFKTGKQGKVENSKWLLKDPYYKVI